MKSNKQSFDPNSLYMTVEEAAKQLRIGRTLAYRLAREYLATDGRSGLPVIRVGKLLRVRRSDLEAWSHAIAERHIADDSAEPAALTSVSSPASKTRARRSASTVEQPALFSA